MKVNIENNFLNVEVQGCKVCPANEVLRSEGLRGVCFLPGILMGAVKPVEEVKKATVTGSQKFKVGHCKMQIKLE